MVKARVKTRHVDPQMAHVAEKRTNEIRRTWNNWGDHSLIALCISCYLQGIEDAVEAQVDQERRER
jgi:hypothetical protein